MRAPPAGIMSRAQYRKRRPAGSSNYRQYLNRAAAAATKKSRTLQRSVRPSAPRAPARPYSGARYDPGLQPMSMLDYMASSNLGGAADAFNFQDPYYYAPYQGPDELAAQAGGYAQDWTEPFLAQAYRERGNADAGGAGGLYVSHTSPGKYGVATSYAQGKNPYDTTVSDLLTGGPKLAQGALGDLLTDQGRRAAGREQHAQDLANFWRQIADAYEGGEISKAKARQAFYGSMISLATRDVQSRERLGQQAGQFGQRQAQQQSQFVSRQAQSAHYRNIAAQISGYRAKVYGKHTAAETKLAQQKFNQSVQQAWARIGISQGHLKLAIDHANAGKAKDRRYNLGHSMQLGFWVDNAGRRMKHPPKGLPKKPPPRYKPGSGKGKKSAFGGTFKP